MWENMSFKSLYGYIRRSHQKVKLLLHMQHDSTIQMELIYCTCNTTLQGIIENFKAC